MVDKYCDHGAYGTYAATPTWGSAQDGDGTVSTVGTPSTAAVVFTGVPSSGAIAVLGITLSPTWATNADTCANNLATAINASASTASGPASFTVKSQVRNHVYARGPAGGAPAGTCQIMTRQASAAHAGLIAVTHTLNNVSSASTINFSGGSGGCWGYLFNAATVWASSVAQFAYGCWGTGQPFTGVMAAGDTVNLRSAKTINISGTVNVRLSAMGSALQPVRFLVDNSTLWSDGTNPKISIIGTAGGGYTADFSSSATTYAHIQSHLYSDATYALNFERSAVASTSDYMRVGCGGPWRLDFVRFACLQNGAFAQPSESNNSTASGYTLLRGCKFQSGMQLSLPIIPWGVSGNSVRLDMQDCTFQLTSATDVQTQVISLGSATNGLLSFDNCKFVGFVPGSRMHAANPSFTVNNQSAVFRNCALGGISRLGPDFFGAPVGFDAYRQPRGVYISGQNGNREFVINTPHGYVGWAAAQGYPTLNAVLIDGVTPWSIRMIPSTLASSVNPQGPLESPRLGKINTLGTGVRTATIELLIDTTLSWTKKSIGVVVEYIDVAGAVQVIESYDPTNGALDASTAAWSTTTFSDGGTLTFNKRKFAITTPTAVAADSEISFYLRLYETVSNATQGVFIDPEIVVS